MSTLAPLSPDAIVRLAKLLGMLGSDHIGERAAAGLKATELLRANGVTWADLIQQLNNPAPRHSKQSFTDRVWVVVGRACLDRHNESERGASLTAWEYGFVTDILDRGWDLSEKQEAVLRRIAGKMRVDWSAE